MIGIVTSLSNLDRAAARVQKTLIAVRRVEDQMASTQLRLNTLFKQGKANTEQYGVQVDRLATAQADLVVKNLDVKLAQDALNDTQILFATVVANTAINSLFLLKSAFAGVTLAQVKNTIVSKLMITTHGRLAIGLRTTGTAAIFTAAGIKAATLASLRFMATPFGAVLTAIGIGFLALQTNAFGAADALQKLTGINARLLDNYEDFDKQLKTNTQLLEEFKKGAKVAATSATPQLSGAVDEASGSLTGLSTSIGALTSGGATGGGSTGGGGSLPQLSGQLSMAAQAFVNMRKEAESALVLLEKPPQFVIQSAFEVGFQQLLTGKSAEDAFKEQQAFNAFVIEQRKKVQLRQQEFELISSITTAEERNNELIAQVLLRDAKKEELLKRLINLKKVHGNFEEAILAIVSETAEAMLLQKGIGGRINAEEEKRLGFLKANLENQVRILNIQKEQTKELTEQKKSLLDSFELLVGSKPGSPLFGLSGVFRNQRNREGGAASEDARAIIGFQSGIGSTITVGGKTFRSRILDPKVILGGLADAAIALATIQRVLENFGGAAASRLRGALGLGTGARGGTGISPFLAAFGAGNAADFSNAISRGLVRAIQNPFGTRTINDPSRVNPNIQANTFSFIPANQQGGFGSKAGQPEDTSPGASVTPFFITARGRARISATKTPEGVAQTIWSGGVLGRSQSGVLKNRRGQVMAALARIQAETGRMSVFSPFTELIPFIDQLAMRKRATRFREADRARRNSQLRGTIANDARNRAMRLRDRPLLLAGFRVDPEGGREDFQFAIDLIFNFGAFILEKAIPAQIDQVIKNFSSRAAIERGFTQDREQLLKGVTGIKHFRNFEDELQLTQAEQIEILFTRKGNLRENFFREFDDILSFWNKERYGTIGTEAI